MHRAHGCNKSKARKKQAKERRATYCGCPLFLCTGKMAILPDRLFLYNWKSFGIISYQDISFDFSQSGIVDDGKPPKDAKVDKKMWLYANADGSRDMPYKDNRQLNAVSYGKVAITSQEGLNVILLFSNEGGCKGAGGRYGEAAAENVEYTRVYCVYLTDATAL